MTQARGMAMKLRIMQVRRLGASQARWLSILPVVAAIAGLPALPAQAQPVDCLPMQQKLVPIPEIVTDDAGHLRGTIVLDHHLAPAHFPIPLPAPTVPRA